MTDLEIVAEQPQAGVATLLRMKLGAEHLALAAHGGKGAAVSAQAQSRFIGYLGGCKTVHEVEVGAGVYALEQSVLADW